MATIHQQIKKLEADAEIAYSIQERAKTPGGRLTNLGKDVLYALVKNDVPPSEIAKILDITPSAVVQNAKKIK